MQECMSPQRRREVIDRMLRAGLLRLALMRADPANADAEQQEALEELTILRELKAKERIK